MSKNISSIRDAIPDLSLELEQKFEAFRELVYKYNDKLNLVARSTVADAAKRHFADCYYALKSIDTSFLNSDKIYDFGAGNGFPGIIAGLLFPNHQIVMVERDLRKSEFLKIAISHLLLPNASVFAGDSTQLPKGSVHFGISRAMAPLGRFLLETRQCVAPGGQVLLFKSENWPVELSQCPPVIFDHWDVYFFKEYQYDKGAANVLVRCERK